MDTSASGQSSSLYLFEKFEVGVIHLDAERRVLAMNDFARKVLPVDENSRLTGSSPLSTRSAPSPRWVFCSTRHRLARWPVPPP